MAATLLILTAILLNIPADGCVEIIGGKEVRNHSVPYMALVRSGGGICGGALIKPDWVLTAAHCLTREKMTVTLGALSLTQKEKEKQQFTVTQTFPHNQFNNKTGENDLMLLKMNKPAKLNKFVSTLALPKPQTDVKPKTQCSVAGWGTTKPKKTKPSDKLMQVTVRVVSRDKCRKFYKRIKITEEMLCAWDKRGKKDTSRGDSGGPLVCGGQFTAVVSFGLSPGKAPGVYTLLMPKYIKWIHQVIGGNL